MSISATIFNPVVQRVGRTDKDTITVRMGDAPGHTAGDITMFFQKSEPTETSCGCPEESVVQFITAILEMSGCNYYEFERLTVEGTTAYLTEADFAPVAN